MANNKISTTALDFDAIKASLKSYLQGQADFTDYDFEGSGLSLLLDVLAYNTHYNALYSNLSVNEAFLDSASKRMSVISKAKELGYVPRSATGAIATVNVIINVLPSFADNVLILPKGTQFNTQVEGTTYPFLTQADHSAARVGNTFTFENVMIKEGTLLGYNYTVGVDTAFVIPNANVDLSTLTVQVQENQASSEYDIYTQANTILNIDSTSLVYFIKEIEGGLYEMEFGDDIIGKALSNGNFITISYQSCSGDLPNGAYKFQFSGDLPVGAAASTILTVKAANGADAEDIESIRWTAPRAYAAQNRCVTADDYIVAIRNGFPNSHAVSVWGGEDNVPAEYGKVFISIIPHGSSNATILSDEEKAYIIDTVIKPRKPLTITPVIVDPEYIDLLIDTTFYYNPQKTTLTAGQIESIIRNNIADYNDNNLNNFGSVFRYSKFNAMVDDSEPSIVSNITTIELKKPVNVIYSISSGYTVDISNPIYYSGVPEESILSSGIYVPETSNVCFIDDIPNEDSYTGSLRLFYKDIAGKKIEVKRVGTIDYVKGVLSVSDLIISNILGDEFFFKIKPQSNDVVSYQHQFIIIRNENVKVSAVVDAPTNYIFTRSRT